jgi:hypothetical protein
VHGQVVVDTGRLRGIADQLPHPRRLPRGVEAANARRPGGLPEQRDQDPDRGRLAGAVWPEEAEDLPRPTAKETPASAVAPPG